VAVEVGWLSAMRSSVVERDESLGFKKKKYLSMEPNDTTALTPDDQRFDDAFSHCCCWRTRLARRRRAMTDSRRGASPRLAATARSRDRNARANEQDSWDVALPSHRPASTSTRDSESTSRAPEALLRKKSEGPLTAEEQASDSIGGASSTRSRRARTAQAAQRADELRPNDAAARRPGRARSQAAAVGGDADAALRGDVDVG